MFPFNRTLFKNLECHTKNCRCHMSLVPVPECGLTLKLKHIRKKCHLLSVTLGKVGIVISALRRFPADLSVKYFSG